MWGCEVISYPEEAAAKFKQILSTRPFPHNFLSPVCFFSRISAEKQTAIFHSSVIHNTALVLFLWPTCWLMTAVQPEVFVSFFSPPSSWNSRNLNEKATVFVCKHQNISADVLTSERKEDRITTDLGSLTPLYSIAALIWLLNENYWDGNLGVHSLAVVLH